MQDLQTYLQMIEQSNTEIQSELAYQMLADALESELAIQKEQSLSDKTFALLGQLLSTPFFYSKAGLWRVLCLINSSSHNFSERQCVELNNIFDRYYEDYEQPLLLKSLQVWIDNGLIELPLEFCGS